MEDFMPVRRIALVLGSPLLLLLACLFFWSHAHEVAGAFEHRPGIRAAKGIMAARMPAAAPETAPATTHPAPAALPVLRFRFGFLEFEDDPDPPAR
jgi:hypothetical protein